MTRRPRVHLINPFWDASGGSEWNALQLAEELAEFADVSRWSEHEPDPRLRARFAIRRIRPWLGRFPKSGMFVFVGVYARPGRWVRFTRPDRVRVLYNTFAESKLRRMLTRVPRPKQGDVEILFVSATLRKTVDLPGTVQPSMIDVARFAPGVRQLDTASGDGRFVVGRLSRDVKAKHHKADGLVYRRLAEEGCAIRIMGGTCIAHRVLGAAGITLLPAGAEPPEEFLRGLDAFYYRTSVHFRETQGRVVQEAMACGLPVVCCDDGGGYVEYIEHGRNGFLFRDDAEAIDVLMKLKRDPSHRREIGRAARATMERVFGKEQRREIARRFVG